MHIAREGGKHYTNYHTVCEKAGLVPNSCCQPLYNVKTASVQSSLDAFTIPIRKASTWSREGLLSHICQLIVADDQAFQLVERAEF